MKIHMCAIPIASLGFLLLVVGLGVQAQDCDANMDWVGVPEDDYDRRYASIAEPDGRPLGFNRSFIPYVTEGMPNPCIRVTGTGDRRVEVMAESTPVGSTICTYRQDGQLECSAAGIYFCDQATANEINYEFLCEGNSCEQTDVHFFYRFTISPPASEIDPETWCDNRDTGEYPRTLAVALPPGVTIPPNPKTTPTGGSSHNYTAKSLLGICIVAIATFVISS